MEGFTDLEWQSLVRNLGTLLSAYLLALPVGWDREHHNRSAGLRTFPLVAVASCGFMLVAITSLGGEPQAIGRMLAGVATGIGFIGGGAILKSGERVRGTATAASLWVTGAIGAAVAFGRYEIAFLLSLLTFATFRWMRPFKAREDD